MHVYDILSNLCGVDRTHKIQVRILLQNLGSKRYLDQGCQS